MTGRDLIFVALALLTTASALMSVLTRHVVHAALWLVACLGALAGCYLVLGAELVAAVQLLVYVGAVVVLVLFALMLTRAPIGPNRDLDTSRWQRILAGLIGAAVAGLIAAYVIPVTDALPTPREATETKSVATAIFGTWVWPFELLSLLLLVALIGAFAVSRVTGAAPRRGGSGVSA